MKRLLLSTLIIIAAMSANAQKAKVSLNHIAIYVKDLQRSIAFYTNILHLDTTANPFNDGRHAWFNIGQGLTLHVVQGDKENVPQYRGTHTCFSVADIDAFIKHLVNQGIPYEDSKGNKSAVTNRADGIKQIYFIDPDGYWIEINNDIG